MNDFTKEELEHIFDSVHTDAKYYGDEHIAHPILDKLELMIKNYCEHENIVTYNEANCVYFCMDCSVVTGAI